MEGGVIALEKANNQIIIDQSEFFENSAFVKKKNIFQTIIQLSIYLQIFL